jgi:2-methylcitrate dehydratase PrpD
VAIVTPGILPASTLVTGRQPQWLKQWSRFAKATRFGDLPSEVVSRASLVLLDSLGAIIAGRAEPEMAPARKRLARTARSRKSGSPLLNAFTDGTAGTMLEIDEGNQYARGHPGMHVVPAVLAVSEGKLITGKEAILATVLGYEIGARIGIASKLRVTMHPHGTWGTVGAALSVAKLHKASLKEIVEVINLSSSLGLTTSRRTMLEGGTVRNTYAGFSNMLGMMAYDLVKAGFTGEADGVGSVYGGIAADDWRPEEMTRELGHRWEIARNYFKRHAACRYNHGALDALAEIMAQVGGRIEPESIESIAVETYVWAAQLDHPKPQNMLAAKFSMPFSIATAIVNGSANLDAFRDAARTNPQTMALAAKVTVNEDPALTAKLPGLRPARLRILLKDGRQYEAMAQTNKGDTEDPYSSADVVAKFYEVAGPHLGQDKAAIVVRAMLDLQHAPSLRAIINLCEAA